MSNPDVGMILTPERFKQNYREVKVLGEGADGQVICYAHRADARQQIAVKVPVVGYVKARLNLVYEIKALVEIGSCDQIISLLGFDEYHLPHGPAIYYEYCDLGAAHHFRQRLVEAYGSVPEETVWKMFADLSQALDWLHNKSKNPYIHGDLKSDNVMVTSSPNQLDPRLPTFKLGDFSRAKQYTAQTRDQLEYNGGHEFGPPHLQRIKGGVTLGLDIWNLGSMIQWFALGQFPSADFDDFIAKNPHLMPKDWTRHAIDEIKRTLLPPAVRPLNLSQEAQERRFRFYPNQTVPPFSDKLNRWYLLCHEPDLRKRVSAKRLVKFLVPVAQREIRILSGKRKIDEVQSKLKHLRRGARVLRAGGTGSVGMEALSSHPPPVPARPARRLIR
ncbi:kinase-like domain-containing protein [Lophiotrema nucula]|uniref:Kinase-like domain-containing protein n=1 Tax=Lophiotrema nucula TaxID=690887 RepID=A0A6A5ZEH2_9PLEO|nr:kinase-like domain-containing protein [Lophiotrema nucula]